jgi:hypothetical protein
MSVGKLLAFAVVLIGVIWLLQHPDVWKSKGASPAAAASVPGSAAVGGATSDRNAQLKEAATEADKASSGGAVTENMTPDQIRTLLGNPDSVETATLDNGKVQERWTYRQAGKIVVFENGVAVSVQAP